MDLSTFNQMPDASRVWIYQSNRIFSKEEATQIQTRLDAFAEDWVSHNRALRAKAQLLESQFIVLMVDETQVGASGCSIDKSVHFMKRLQGELGVDLFDRMLFAYQKNENEIATADRDLFAKLFTEGAINNETLVFNHLVETKKDLNEKWLIPLKESWHANFV